MIRDELQLANILREKLAPSFKEIHTNINLASNRFYPDWEKWHGQPVPSAQPQIDILLVDRSLWLLAAELKYFRETPKGQIYPSFYAGIGEALALLRFGFKVVSLWHFFDEELEREDVRRLYRSCDHLVSGLKLPVNYQPFTVYEVGADVEFRALYDSERKELPSAYGTPNPFYSDIDAMRVQDFLRSVLRIPQPR